MKSVAIPGKQSSFEILQLLYMLLPKFIGIMF